MILRDYQTDMLAAARDHMRAGKRRVLLVAPTGSGKRIMACWTVAEAAKRGKRCLLLVHRQELLDQASQTLSEANVPHGVIVAGGGCDGHPVQVASIATLVRRLSVVPVPDFIFTDEAHHAASKTWSKVINFWPHAFSLGFTATPARLDGKGLGPFFDAMVVGPSMRALIAAGWLSHYRLFAPPGPPVDDLDKVVFDFNQAQLEARLDKPKIIGDLVAHYQRICPGKQAVAFAVTIKHSRNIAEALTAAGIPATHLDGETPKPERRQTLADFIAYKVQVLCSVDILGEGLDVPGIEAVIAARPTMSLTLCLQQWGRGFRPKPEPLVILDHAGNCLRHGLPSDERAWVLTDDKIKAPAPSVRICKQCFAAILGAPATCPECGAQLATPSPRKPREQDGELLEVTDDDRDQFARDLRRRELADARDYDSLVALGRARKYRYPEGWAKRVMQARAH